jgi:hypothetical protein
MNQGYCTSRNRAGFFTTDGEFARTERHAKGPRQVRRNAAQPYECGEF